MPYQRIFDQLPYGLLTMDEAVTRCNPSACRLLGRCADEVIGRSLVSFSPARQPDGRVSEAVIQEYRNDALAGDVRIFPWRFCRRGGESMDCELTLQKIDGEGRLLLVSLRELSERKRVEQALHDREEEVRLLLNSTAEAIYGLDLEGNCTFCNPSCLELLGYRSEDELLGRSVHELIHHSFADGRVYPKQDCSACMAFRKDQRICVDNEVFWRKDGTSFPVEYRSYPVLKEGQVIGAVVTFLDISDRKQAQEALLESQMRFQSLAEVAPIGIFHADARGKFQYVNERWLEITGLSRQEALEKGFSWALHPADRQPILKEWCDAVGQDLSFDSECRVLHADGTSRWAYFQIVAERDADGAMIGYVGTITDITESKAAQEELRDRNEFIETVMANLPIGFGVMTWDDRRVVYLNPMMEEVLGWPKEQISYENSFWELAFPDQEYREQIRGQVYEDWLRGESKITSLDCRVTKSSGEIADIYTVYIPMIERNLLITTCQDITERKNVEKELQKRNEFIETVTDNLPIGFGVVSLLDRKLIHINKTLEVIVGWPRDVLYDEVRFWECAFPDAAYRNSLMEKMHADWERGGGSREYQVVKRSGEVADVISHDILIPEENLLVVATLDITEQKRAEKEILELNRDLELRVAERTRELELANQELEAFTYSVSHDLRAPLRAIDGFSAALLEDYADKFDGEARQFLGYLQDGSRDMSALIDGLLKLSRSTRGEMFKESVDLSKLASSVVEDLRRTAPGRRVCLHIPPGISGYADPGLLKVVLENLLGNAWKYTSKEAEASIEFNVEKQGPEEVYFVRDNGAGFNMAYKDKLFLPFQRLHKTDEFPGTGIGLATVQRIIQRHGGTIWAEGTVDGGATFFFTLGPAEGDHG